MSDDSLEGSQSEFWTHLTRLARYHRWAIIAIGLKLGTGIITVALVLSSVTLDRGVVGLNGSLIAWLFLAIEVFAIVALTMLLKEMTNWPVTIAAAVACVAVTLVSNYSVVILALIVLHMVAMRYFRKVGVEVGLLGARLETL